MQDLAMVLENIKNPGAPPHVFCSAQKFAIWYKVLNSKKREGRACRRKDSRESDVERNTNENLEPQPFFEKDISSLQYNNSRKASRVHLCSRDGYWFGAKRNVMERDSHLGRLWSWRKDCYNSPVTNELGKEQIAWFSEEAGG